VGGDVLGADFFFGTASREYRTLDGDGSRSGLAVGLGAQYSDDVSSARFRFSFSLGFESFPRPFLPSRESVVFSLERALMGKRSTGPRMRIEAAVNSDFDSDGCRTGDADGAVSLVWACGGEESLLKARFTKSGAEAYCDLRFAVRGGLFTIEGGLAADKPTVKATALVGMRFSVAKSPFHIHAGIKDMPVNGDDRFISCLRLGVEWSAGSVMEAP
jgi:hypothetical protein